MVNGTGFAEDCSSIIPSLKGAFTIGKITEEQRFDIVRHACPGAGACGGMYTYVYCICKPLPVLKEQTWPTVPTQ